MLTIYVTEGIQSSCLRNCEISKSALFMQQTVKKYSSDSLPEGKEGPPERGRDFTWWSVWKGKEIYHFGRLKGLKGRGYAFCGYEKVEKTFCFCNLFIFCLKNSAFTAVKRNVKF